MCDYGFLISGSGRDLPRYVQADGWGRSSSDIARAFIEDGFVHRGATGARGTGDRDLMVSDRGTLPRGAVADQQASWAEPTAPGGRRMPSAPRERKPALAALAVLLVALGAVAAGYLVINAGHRVGAVEITQQVGQGQRIPASAIKEVEIASNSGINYVAWQYANRVAGVYAAVQIPAGTLLTPAMTTATSNLAQGKVQVGLSLKPGQAPTNLLIGQTVEAYPVGTGSGCGGGTGNGTGNATAATPGVPIA